MYDLLGSLVCSAERAWDLFSKMVSVMHWDAVGHTFLFEVSPLFELSLVEIEAIYVLPG
jgi:hypothetical protein